MSLVGFCFIFLCGAFILVFSGSPFYSVFGVLIVALSHAGLMAYLGIPFFSLLVVIIYAGGMLVVFLFSTILSADRFPVFSLVYFSLVLPGVWFLVLPLVNSYFSLFWSNNITSSSINQNLASLYTNWSMVLYVVGIVLFMGLLGVLALSFENGIKSLRRL
uniref:NADH-ubiquinone oxidoreductase chain 6 n=1 Tax=Macrophiothrix sp. TaxID=3135532 RepID=A0AAU6PWZ9_9ECHI